MKKAKTRRSVGDMKPNPYDGADLLIRTAAGRPDLAVDYDEARKIFNRYGTDPDVYPVRIYLSRYGVFASLPDGRRAFFISDEGLIYSRLGGYRGRIRQAIVSRIAAWVGGLSGAVAAAAAAISISAWAFSALVTAIIVGVVIVYRWMYAPTAAPASPTVHQAEYADKTREEHG